MQLALAGRVLGSEHPLEEDIRMAAITGFPWLVIEESKLARFLAQAEFTIRDLKRLFLRTQPAALATLSLANADIAHLPQVEAFCKQARRVGAPVVVLEVDQVDARLALLANVAQKWSVVLALAVTEKGDFDRIRQTVRQLSHPALGLYVDTVSLWRAQNRLHPSDADYTVLLSVSDIDEESQSVLPGRGILPLKVLLAPLFIGGYDSLAVLSLDHQDAFAPQQIAQAGYAALSGLLLQIGWEVEHE